MSKAFTKEDDTGDAPVRPRLVSPLPPGARNYLTPGGARRLREELARLAEVERPAFLAQGAGAREELARVEQRIAYLEQSLRSAEVTAPPPPPHEVVRFGARVTVRDPAGAATTYQIVGVDEADADRHEVSWLSPIGRALLNARLGQKVPFRFPGGAALLEVVRIEYA
ncbi:MAG: GreA/GreB family elongation factor [Opitutaceae bacterium]|nr:GreA/GreB family elongation factor [Opitutaceae bacterium]